MRRLAIRSQTSYENGSVMCTTACVCVCVASVTGKLALVGSGDARVVRTTEEVMGLASFAHGRVEKLKCVAGEGGGVCGGRMVGAEEVISLLGIDLPATGVKSASLIVCTGGDAVAKIEDGFAPKHAEQSFLYVPTSCLITLEQLPDCMVYKKGRGVKSVSCTVTHNYHTVCVTCTDGVFALFDPLPAVFLVGMDRVALVEEMRSRWPALVVGGSRCREDGQGDVTMFWTEDTVRRV